MDGKRPRLRSIRGWVAFAAAAGLALALLVAVTRPSSSAPQRVPQSHVAVAPLSGRRVAPTLRGDLLAGDMSDFRLGNGRIVLINFWASWCDPCRREARQLARYNARWDAAPLVSVAVQDRASSARAFMRRYGWRFPVLFDGEGNLYEPYRLPGLPTTVVTDIRGRIAAVLLGPQTVASLHRTAEAVRRAGA